MPRPAFPSVAAVTAAATLALAAASFKTGPPPAHTGGFGEPTCHECHADNDLNEPGGTLVIDGVPRSYAAGRTYELKVLLRRAGMLRGGFQLAARFEDGDSLGRPAGMLEPADVRTQVVWDTTTHIGYIEHSAEGTSVINAATEWKIRWTAPIPRGLVVFNVAANAANDDDSPLGDFIYTTVKRTYTPAPRR